MPSTFQRQQTIGDVKNGIQSDDAAPGRLVGCAIAVMAVLAPAIGGSIGLWPAAALLAGLGCLLVLSPPRRSLGAAANWVCLCLLLLGASAWLPAHWFASPDWRSAMLSHLGIALPPTRSPQPWLTLEASYLLMGNMAWAYFVFAHPWRQSTRRMAVWIFCAGILVLTLMALGAHWTGHKIPWWPRVVNSPADFGFFANRNQTANVLALSGILLAATAYDDLRAGRKRAAFWLMGLAAVGVALVIAYSRAGILLFFVGITVWALFAVRFSTSAKSLAVLFTTVLLLLAAFLTFGGETLKRFQLLASGGPRDFRVPIQQDAMQLSLHHPWLGSGLGNFEPLFRMVREKSRQQDYALHPDSDWLWTAVELGWIAVAALLTGLVVWVRRCFPFDSPESAPLRLAAMLYGLGFAAAGFVDVSGHRIGSFWPALFAMSLAIHSDRSEIRERWVAPFFRWTGLMLLAIAGCWLATAMGYLSLPTSDSLARHQRAAGDGFEGADYDRIVEATTTALHIAPLDWNSYSQRAAAEADLAETDAAIHDFRVARFLQPYFVDSCVYEGSLWLDLGQPDHALEAWREALRRAPDGGGYLFNAMLSAAASHPEIRTGLEALALSESRYQLPLMSASSPPEFKTRLDAFLSADPELKRLSREERRTLFMLWSQKGDAASLAEMLRTHPQWEQEDWSILARQYAGAGDFHRAYETMLRFARRPALPKLETRSSKSDLERSFARDPNDITSGLALYGLQSRGGNLDAALETLRKLEHSQPKSRHLIFMEAELHAQREDWQAAWTAWEEFAAGGG